MIRTMKDRGITLLALVVTIVVLLILAGITISLVFGPNGVVKKAQEADENTKIAQVREKLELAKGPEYIEGNGQYDPDSYFQRIEDEKIINDKDKDVVDNEDGTYDVTTTPGYIFIITLVPSKDNVEDIQIDYIGKVDGPRIREVNVSNKTTSSISVEVETSNAEGATYTYYYKKEGKTEWIKAGESKEWTYTFNGLEANVIYNIKVVVEKDGKTAEKETSTITGELPEGAVQFSPVEWKNGQASTVITTTETGYTLQYQIGGIEESGWTNTTSGTTIENLQHGTTVYGRLFDGTNGSKTASIDIKDEVSPTVTVAEETITTNSISVNVQAGDSESGMADVPTYTYYIKKNGEANSSYTSPTEATGITQNTYTFAGLIQGTSYDIKVEVNGDKAGNIGTGTLLNKTTEEIGGATGGLIEGNIIASSPTWSNGEASITLSTSTGLTIQYQVNGIDDGNWTTGTNVTGLNHNDTVYARLTDGTNYGDEASVSITDGTAPSAPTISISSGTSGNNSYYKSNVTVTITAGSDGQSGANQVRYSVSGAQTVNETTTAAGTTSASITITAEGTSTITAYTIDKVGNVSTEATQTINKDSTAPSTASLTVGTVGTTSIVVTARGADATSGIYSYQFQRSTTSSTSGFTTVATRTSTATSYSYTYTGLKDGTTYYLRVKVTDRAGNTKTGTAVTQVTERKLATNVNELKEGDYVNYIDKNGVTRKCAVLYDSSSSYGVQIITIDVFDNFWFGSKSSNETDSVIANRYNGAITTLNSAANNYLNTNYAISARSVGTIPDNPSADTAYYSFPSNYNVSYNLRAEDTNYLTDYNQLKKLNLLKADQGYYLASRVIENGYNEISSSMDVLTFSIRVISGSSLRESLYSLAVYPGNYETGRMRSDGYACRPVFTLKPGLKVIGGNGTESSPYTLGT